MGEQLGKLIGDESDYAESWEVVDHGADQSIVAGGPLQGKALAELIAEHRTWLLGTEVPHGPFPLLLKYLEKPQLDPFASPGRATMALLMESV